MIRLLKILLLTTELAVALGLPMPSFLNHPLLRFGAWRRDRKRMKSLPRKTRALESLYKRNPGLGDDWNRSTHIRRKSDFHD